MEPSGVRQGYIMSPFALQCKYGGSDEGIENKDGEDGSEISGRKESGDCLASCMQMTWFYVASQRKT